MTFGAIDYNSLGMALVVLQSWMASTGLALQRMAQVETEAAAAKNKGQQTDGWKVKQVVGFAMNLGSQPLNAVALTFCSVSVIGALNSSINIINSMFLSWWQGVELNRQSLLATFLGIVGCLGIVGLAPGGGSEEVQLERALRFLHFWDYPRLASLVIALIAFAVFATPSRSSQARARPSLRWRSLNAFSGSIPSFAWPSSCPRSC